MLIKRRVKKNQIHAVSQVGKPERIFLEGEKYWWIPLFVPRYGMMTFIYTIKNEFSEIPISEPKYF